MQCYWCKKPIEEGAKVCHECGRPQGTLGLIASITTVVGVLVALLGAVLSSYQAFQTANDSKNVTVALHNAKEAAKDSELALNKANAAANSAESAVQNIKEIAKDMAKMHEMTLYDRFDILMENRRNCPQASCKELKKVSTQLHRYYQNFVSQDQPYLTHKDKAEIDGTWCGNVARLFYYYKPNKTNSSMHNLAKDFIEQCKYKKEFMDEIRRWMNQ